MIEPRYWEVRLSPFYVVKGIAAQADQALIRESGRTLGIHVSAIRAIYVGVVDSSATLRQAGPAARLVEYKQD